MKDDERIADVDRRDGASIAVIVTAELDSASFVWLDELRPAFSG